MVENAVGKMVREGGAGSAAALSTVAFANAWPSGAFDAVTASVDIVHDRGTAPCATRPGPLGTSRTADGRIGYGCTASSRPPFVTYSRPSGVDTDWSVGCTRTEADGSCDSGSTVIAPAACNV